MAKSARRTVRRPPPRAAAIAGNPLLTSMQPSFRHQGIFICAFDFTRNNTVVLATARQNLQVFLNGFLGAIASFTQDDNTAAANVTAQANWLVAAQSIDMPNAQFNLSFLAVCPFDHTHFNHPPLAGVPNATGKIIVITMNIDRATGLVSQSASNPIGVTEA
jgi:hypothetical protein